MDSGDGPVNNDIKIQEAPYDWKIDGASFFRFIFDLCLQKTKLLIWLEIVSGEYGSFFFSDNICTRIA